MSALKGTILGTQGLNIDTRCTFLALKTLEFSVFREIPSLQPMIQQLLGRLRRPEAGQKG
jgi:hypothetical protein